MSPGGVRVGAPALTTRGMKEPEFREIARFMDRAAKLAIKIQQTSGKMLKEFVIAIEVSRLVWVRHLDTWKKLTDRARWSSNDTCLARPEWDFLFSWHSDFAQRRRISLVSVTLW